MRSGTPPEVLKKVSDALKKVYDSPEYQKFLKDQYGDPHSFEDSAHAPAFVKQQLEDMKKTLAK
jgi:tripartite-type tricarboxylate transporter receptor subunit TctC